MEPCGCGHWGFHSGTLCAIRARAVQCYGQDGRLGRGVYLCSRKAEICGSERSTGSGDGGLVRRKVRFRHPALLAHLAEGDDGELLGLDIRTKIGKAR